MAVVVVRYAFEFQFTLLGCLDCVNRWHLRDVVNVFEDIIVLLYGTGAG
jgi:hypothetical protein